MDINSIRYLIAGSLLLLMCYQNKIDAVTILAIVSGLLIPTAPITEKLRNLTEEEKEKKSSLEKV